MSTINNGSDITLPLSCLVFCHSSNNSIIGTIMLKQANIVYHIVRNYDISRAFIQINISYIGSIAKYVLDHIIEYNLNHSKS
jgi:hypothetical protein